MDELTMVRDLGHETPQPDPGRLAAGRAALAKEARAETTARPHSLWRRRATYSWAAAAAVAAAMVLPSLPDRDARTAGPAETDAAATAGAAAPGKAPRSLGKQSMRPASQVLDLAATAALKEPDVLPRPDQFLYRSDRDPDGKLIYEIWKSIDGRHDGQVIRYDPGQTDKFPLPGCPAGSEGIAEQGGGCDFQPAYLRDLPSDVQGMLAYLRERNERGNADTTANSTAKDIWTLAAAHHLRPAQRAALFRAAGTVPGLEVRDGVTDASGRAGTGVAWTYAGGPEMVWIFDPKTYAYLGTPTETATTGIVDRVGDKP